jgi:hypothetical protein
MIFALWNPSVACEARRSGKKLLRLAGLSGMSPKTYSELAGCSRLIGRWS